MPERAYTVSEIDALREVCADRWVWGTSWIPHEPDGALRHYDMKAVEELVRTHMLAGHTAADLIEEDRANPPS